MTNKALLADINAQWGKNASALLEFVHRLSAEAYTMGIGFCVSLQRPGHIVVDARYVHDGGMPIALRMEIGIDNRLKLEAARLCAENDQYKFVPPGLSILEEHGWTRIAEDEWLSPNLDFSFAWLARRHVS